jgi:hypothetical protein
MHNNGKYHVAEFERTLGYAVTALCHLRCPQAILGLHAWCKNVAGLKLAWIKAAAEKASARLVFDLNTFELSWAGQKT